MATLTTAVNSLFNYYGIDAQEGFLAAFGNNGEDREEFHSWCVENEFDLHERSPHWQDVLQVANQELEMCGVESYCDPEDSDITLLSYCNAGDLYSPTLAYIHVTCEFMVLSENEWIEGQPLVALVDYVDGPAALGVSENCTDGYTRRFWYVEKDLVERCFFVSLAVRPWDVARLCDPENFCDSFDQFRALESYIIGDPVPVSEKATR